MTINGFDYWMSQVDEELVRLCDLTSLDLPDYAYWDAWSAGMAVHDTALMAIGNAGSF